MKRTTANQSMICFAVILRASGACGSALEAERILNGDDKAKTKVEAQAPPPKVFETESMSIAEVSEKAVPSVVNISTKKKVTIRSRRFQ